MTHYSESFFFQPDRELEINVEEIYSTLLTNSLKGTRVLSMKAPAVSTEFVRSSSKTKARAQSDGALLEVEYPSRRDIASKVKRKHGTERLFGYTSTWAADAYPAGYGQRSATALEREDTVYQMKNTFTTAAINMSKLRARVVAREGDGEAISEIFAKMWGITQKDAECIPNLTVDGSEATRLSALEDRAYHALSSHPSVAGGYRVDMASITQDSLGKDIPLNWARIRTGAKMIAQVQLTGDAEMAGLLKQLDEDVPFKMTLDITEESQPKYYRTYPWESAMLQAMTKSDIDSRTNERILPEIDQARSLHMTLGEALSKKIALNPNVRFSGSWRHIADIMRVKSRNTLENTIRLIEMYQTGRSLLADEEEEEMEELERSILGKSFQVPTFKVTKDRVTSVMHKEYISGRQMPDMVSHGKSKTRFSLSEARHGGLGRDLTHGNALHLAVYTNTVKSNSIRASIQLLNSVKDPNPGQPGKVAFRLRDQTLYDCEEIREIGKSLFDESFVATLEAIVKNLVSKDDVRPQHHVTEIWNYLSGRTRPRRPCPVEGGLSDLVEVLRTAPEGWTMYYWARVSIGKWNHMSQSHILAPIRAGEEVDLIAAFKRGVIERAKYWENFYALQHTSLHEKCKATREKRSNEDIDHTVLTRDISESVGKYIPPHLRKREHLGRMYEEHDAQVNGMNRNDYERLALAQVKQKFFKNLYVKSTDRLVSVGVSNDVMREAYIESYQARWISMERRVAKAKRTGKPFRLGGKVVEENPWGPLVEEFPESLEGVRSWACTLDTIGWTVHPDVMWERLEKSISELWQDLAKELEQVMNLINETADEDAEAQILHNLEQQQKLLPEQMIMHSSITLPSFGYVAPYTLPSKSVTVMQGAEMSRALYTPLSMTTAYASREEGEDENDGWGDDDDESDFFNILMKADTFASLSKTSQDMPSIQHFETPALTYREIWKKLGFREIEDDRMKFALGVTADVDLDSEHKDSFIGPVVLVTEERKTLRMWGSKVPGIAKRAGIHLEQIMKDDM